MTLDELLRLESSSRLEAGHTKPILRTRVNPWDERTLHEALRDCAEASDGIRIAWANEEGVLFRRHPIVADPSVDVGQAVVEYDR